MKQKRRFGRQSIFSLAGWLFTDLLLAMMLIFLAASGVGSPPPPTTPTPTPQIQALDRNPFTFTIYDYPGNLGPDQARLEDEVNTDLQNAGVSNRKIGLVLTFGGTSAGAGYAQSLNDTILSGMPNFHDAILRNFLSLGNPVNEFYLELYFFV